VSRISVMQLIDTLDAGGAERVAVNFANLLPRDRYTSWLCTTRRDGALADLVMHDVQRLALDRRTRLDIPPLRRLADVVRAQRIHILHAHGASLFVGLFASLRPPYPAVIWHVHHLHQRDEYPASLYRLVAARAEAVVTVSQQVADWATRRLRIAADRVVYLPNFSIPGAGTGAPSPPLPGVKGSRIACVANLRPQKDQCTLIDAFARVVPAAPGAHLLLIGGGPDARYRTAVHEHIARHRLEAHVSWLGERADVPAILAQCDIAVLSSATEGFPLSLVEYGHAGLPVVATRVGQCGDVLDNGSAGLLVDPRNAAQLGAALLSLWHSRAQRRVLGKRLQRRVHERYSFEPALRQLCGLYERFAPAP
jgi:glycosyltransferase involved in cell wall biosynthesis